MRSTEWASTAARHAAPAQRGRPRPPQVAGSYSGAEEGSIFEIKFDAASPGADLQFVSQYPQEKEFLYPPGTQLTCQGVSQEGRKRVLRLAAAYNPDNVLMRLTAAIPSRMAWLAARLVSSPR